MQKNDEKRNSLSSAELSLLWVGCLLLALGPSAFALMTFQRNYSFSWFRYFSVPIAIMEIAIILICILANFRPRSAFSRLSIRTQYSAILFLFGIMVSTSQAEHWTASIFMLLTTIHLCLAFATFDVFRRNGESVARQFLCAAAFGAGIYVCIATVLLFSVRNQTDFSWINQGIGGSSVRHLAFFGVVAGGLGAGLLATASRRRERIVFATCLLLGSYLIALSGSRGGFGALLVASILGIILASRADSRANRALILLAVVTGALISLVWIPPHPDYGLPRIINRAAADLNDMEGFTSGRLALWSEAWDLFLVSPIYGYGEGQYQYVSVVSQGKWTQPHNILLQILVQWGLLASLGLAGMLAPILVGLRSLVATTRRVSIPALCGACAILAIAMLDAALFYAYDASIIAICLSAMAAAIHNQKSGQTT